jgi:S-adenosylmethionine hydrolase
VTDLFLGNVALLNHGQEMDVEIVSVDNISFKKPHLAFYQNNILDAQVLYIDYFGNVVLNVTKDYFEQCRQGRNMKIHFMRQEEITQIHVHYNDVDVSQPVCLFNTSNHLEIAINQGNAAQLFGFSESTDRSLFYNSIKIFFE